MVCRRKSPRLFFRKVRGGGGYANEAESIIEVDLTSPWTNPLAVYVHEQIHLKHWDWTEHQVRRETAHRMTAMTNRDAVGLLRLILRRGRVFESDDE